MYLVHKLGIAKTLNSITAVFLHLFANNTNSHSLTATATSGFLFDGVVFSGSQIMVLSFGHNLLYHLGT